MRGYKPFVAPKQAEQVTSTTDIFNLPAANDSGNDIPMAISRDDLGGKKQQNISTRLDVDFEENNSAGVTLRACDRSLCCSLCGYLIKEVKIQKSACLNPPF